MKNLTINALEELCYIAKTAAIEAGQHIQSQFDSAYKTHTKKGGDSIASQVVTEVDMKAQEIILGHLQAGSKKYDLGLLTEENEDDHSRLTKDYFWCIDPMDGTLPFTEHRTGYAVSIALISQSGDPSIGVVYIPDTGDCYTSIMNRGVELNDAPFVREGTDTDEFHFYMDKSFLSETYIDFVKAKLMAWAVPDSGHHLHYHANYGGVRNAIGVLSSHLGCYFKFPKKQNGCGSIWDYAATRLFFEELGLIVTNAQGDPLHLNNPTTTFMNEQGILYATHQELADFIMDLRKQV